MQVCSPADSGFTEVVDGVHIAPVVTGEQMSVQHFHIEPGAVVPEHSHGNEQVGFVACGTFTFRVDGTEYIIDSGESYHVTAGEPHEAENRTDEPVRGIDVFSPPRAEPDWG
ncbi:cupin domain-containing protein [Halobacteriales archaeon QS_4_62_28]|nr:MAG: cupin domain-containing protein [Halobacteriales archaeon QS_4_62_28]